MRCDDRDWVHARLQRMASAIERDVGLAELPNRLKIAINACLVLAGARPAARLEYVFPPDSANPLGASSHLGRELRAVVRAAARRGRRLGLVNFGGHAYEPLLADLDASAARDLATLRDSVGSDLDEPLVSAMGRALGYRCPYPRPFPASADTATLVVRIVDAHTGQGDEGWLAGFACGSASAAADARRDMRLGLLPAASRALAGAIVRSIDGSRTWVVEGFGVRR